MGDQGLRPPKRFDPGDLADVPSADLTNRECLSGAVREAFPLPRSGAFKDLLDAIDTGGRIRP
ncbi:hypothetical protein GCM10023264_11540 [Sphingomonas daechungensis]|uniref:hypothetical protein n=1 Tax=Sphingomonas daechungensis TaxID=1176646 RepID=UPI0031F174FF